MTGFLCALGIAGSTAFSVGWSSDANDEGAYLLLCGGALLLVIAGVGGLIRLVI